MALPPSKSPMPGGATSVDLASAAINNESPRYSSVLVVKNKRILLDNNLPSSQGHNNYSWYAALEIHEGSAVLESLNLDQLAALSNSHHPPPWYQIDVSEAQRQIVICYECPSAQGPASQHRFALFDAVQNIHVRTLRLTFKDAISLVQTKGTLTNQSLRISIHQEPSFRAGHHSPQLSIGRSGAGSPPLPQHYIPRPSSSQSQLGLTASQATPWAHQSSQRPGSSQSYVIPTSAQIPPRQNRFQRLPRFENPARRINSPKPLQSSGDDVLDGTVGTHGGGLARGHTRPLRATNRRAPVNVSIPKKRVLPFDVIPESLEHVSRSSTPQITEEPLSVDSAAQQVDTQMSTQFLEKLESQLTDSHDTSQPLDDMSQHFHVATESPATSLPQRSGLNRVDVTRPDSRASLSSVRLRRGRNPYQNDAASSTSLKRTMQETSVTLPVAKKLQVEAGVQTVSRTSDKGTQIDQDATYARMVYLVPFLAEITMRNWKRTIENEKQDHATTDTAVVEQALGETLKLFEASKALLKDV